MLRRLRGSYRVVIIALVVLGVGFEVFTWSRHAQGEINDPPSATERFMIAPHLLLLHLSNHSWWADLALDNTESSKGVEKMREGYLNQIQVLTEEKAALTEQLLSANKALDSFRNEAKECTFLLEEKERDFEANVDAFRAEKESFSAELEARAKSVDELENLVKNLMALNASSHVAKVEQRVDCKSVGDQPNTECKR